MTVCVASICERTTLIGMADRMLTAGDLEFAPRLSKIRWLTTSIVAMVAGDLSLAFELLDDIERTVRARIATEPRNWWLVRDVADLWRSAHLRRSQRDAETLILSPLGLTTETFISRQHELAPAVADGLAQALRAFELSAMEVIFAGIDPEGSHLYQANGASIRSCDAIGFAAIGSGAYHARSELRVAGHTAVTPLPTGLYHTFAGKKRAEVAPGVGAETDTFIIWQLGRSSYIREDLMQTVEQAFGRAVAQSAQIAADTEQAVAQAIEEILTPQPAAVQAAPAVADGGEQPVAAPDPVPAPADLPQPVPPADGAA
jgi:ATP-dependent protease HslVU (ClpYQ) peptidase subunit